MISETNLYLPLFILPFVAFLQSTILPHLEVVGLRLDLVLLTVISWSLIRGMREGMIWGFIGGSLIDLLSAAPFGVHTFAMILCGVISGLGGRNVFRQNLLLSLGITAVASVAYYVVSMLLLQVSGWSVSWLATFGSVVIPIALLNTLSIPLIHRLVQNLERFTGRQELSW